MTAVDFSAFVDELATLSGAAILPFSGLLLPLPTKMRAAFLIPSPKPIARAKL